MGPVPPALLYWWKLDDNYLDSEASADFTPGGGGGLAFTPAARLDGQTHALVNLGASGTDNMTAILSVPSSFSILFWFNTSELSVFDVMYDKQLMHGLSVTYNFGGPRLLFWLQNGGASLSVSPIIDPPSFNHFALTVGANNGATTYLNGGLKANNPALTSSQWSNGDLAVGEANPFMMNTIAPFALDSLRIYSGELDLAGVQAIYNSELPAP